VNVWKALQSMVLPGECVGASTIRPGQTAMSVCRSSTTRRGAERPHQTHTSVKVIACQILFLSNRTRGRCLYTGSYVLMIIIILSNNLFRCSTIESCVFYELTTKIWFELLWAIWFRSWMREKKLLYWNSRQHIQSVNTVFVEKMFLLLNNGTASYHLGFRWIYFYLGS